MKTFKVSPIGKQSCLVIFLFFFVIWLCMLFFSMPEVYGAERFTYFSVTGNSVKLTWQKNTEPDMKVYFIRQIGKSGWAVEHPDTTLTAKLSVPKYYTKLAFYLTAVDSTFMESAPSDTVSAIFCQEAGLFCDIDRDSLVNVVDKALFANAMGALISDWQFSEKKDFNGDGTIDIFDRPLLNKNMGAILQ